MVVDKGKNKERIVLSKGSMEVFKTQLAAMRIYKKTYKAKKEILNKFSKEIAEELEKKLKKILEEEKPDIKEIIKLKELFRFDKNKLLNSLNQEIDRVEIEKTREIIDQYSSIEETIERKIDNCLKNLSLQKESSKNKTTVYLSKDKDLYIEPKERHCYPMRSDQAFDILMSLNSKYQPTESICHKIKVANTAALRKAIGKLNMTIKSHLGLTTNFIESKPGFGYRINERYELIKD